MTVVSTLALTPVHTQCRIQSIEATPSLMDVLHGRLVEVAVVVAVAVVAVAVVVEVPIIARPAAMMMQALVKVAMEVVAMAADQVVAVRRLARTLQRSPAFPFSKCTVKYVRLAASVVR